MKTLFFFDISKYIKSWIFYLALALLFVFGLFTGTKANLSVGSGVFLNSPYSIGYVLGLISLMMIFIATVFGYQLLFKEWDSNFDTMFFSIDVKKKDYIMSRALVLVILSFLSYLFFVVGFSVGHLLRDGEEMKQGFIIFHYLFPSLVFGFVNCVFVCSILCLVAWSSKNKLLVAVTGVMLYVVYMITLIFSNSPFMANATPQSLEVQYIASMLDPFGLSAYFTESKDYTVAQRNDSVVQLKGVLIYNRIWVLCLSFFFYFLSYYTFSIGKKRYAKSKTKNLNMLALSTMPITHTEYTKVAVIEGRIAQAKAVISFAKVDMIYLFKSTALVLASIALLFFLGMEMYAEIEKGIRLPQKYASSGLMANTINENLHMLLALLSLYFMWDIFWRSNTSRFDLIENTTIHAKVKPIGHSVSTSIVLLFFTTLSILLGLVFQYGYGYAAVDFKVYLPIYLFNTMPLILLCIIFVFINNIIKNRYAALCLMIALTVVLISPLVNKVMPNPLLRFTSDFGGVYSDFLGYGPYLKSFVTRLVFGVAVFATIYPLLYMSFNKSFDWIKLLTSAVFLGVSYMAGTTFLNGYVPKNDAVVMTENIAYEKKYRAIHQHKNQPIITNVNTHVDLYPSNNSYTITGAYILKNLHKESIQKILFNVNSTMKIRSAFMVHHGDTMHIDKHVSEISLAKSMQPRDSATMHFELEYHWLAVNGHQSFNAIVENGSFMRISRYYPYFGYDSNHEIDNEKIRKEAGLGEATQVKKLEAKRDSIQDFVNLSMTLSTEENQTAIGTGDLVKTWKEGNRNYFHYKTPEPIPFRFALSSARYAVKSTEHNGIMINVYYHPSHHENVYHLIANAKHTLDYCVGNFGRYPFKYLNFAEISSFTKGFAATAYPSVIFMNEDMIFHANIKGDKQQDVINELAGHEVSHLWWGNNQIDPDDREGGPMLTESLAMYTEMMLYKKMYGVAKMKERLAVHEQIYEAEKGFTTDQPLYKVTDENTHISYSKGAMALVKLSEMIGEDNMNKALRNFLLKHKFPNPKPVSTDFIEEILRVAEVVHHDEIRKVLMDK
jgi:ABC-2 type transport system permease protein